MENNIKIICGDITSLQVDAIVNSANPSYLRGGGVSGAIHKAAGIELEKECLSIDKSKLPKGQLLITKGYNLPAKYVIHAIAPRARIPGKISEEEKEKLANCYRDSIFTASQYNIKTLAFPSLGTGIYTLPIEEVSIIAMKAIIKMINDIKPYKFEQIIMVTHSEEDFKMYNNALEKLSNIN